MPLGRTALCQGLTKRREVVGRVADEGEVEAVAEVAVVVAEEVDRNGMRGHAAGSYVSKAIHRPLQETALSGSKVSQT